MNSQTFKSGVAAEMANASEMARHALFAAASRVIHYHQAALDGKVRRMMLKADTRNVPGREHAAAAEAT